MKSLGMGLTRSDSARVAYGPRITASTVHAAYHGGSVFIFTARDNEPWGDIFRTLREHEFQIQQYLDGSLFVTKKLHDEHRERRDVLANQCTNCGRVELSRINAPADPPGVDEEECQECGTVHDPLGIR